MKSFQSGKWLKRGDYRSFEPTPVNRPWRIDEPRILEVMSRADRHLGRLDMFSEYVPDLKLFIRMHVVKEATRSSAIEDTQTEMEEALLPEEEIAEERRDDWREVNNYIQALEAGVKDLETLPFSNRLLRQAHEILMQGVRGEHKTPGEFRRSQNWIGGSNPGNARFVPPIHENVPELMGDLEQFAHNAELHLPPLIKAAIMHYQFETIHPFLDGNGRIGRLMITLYLISQGILKQPVLYLSDFLERHREEYYERLTRVREKDAMDEWLDFFLDGVAVTAEKGVQTFDRILKFKEHWEEQMHQWKSSTASGLALFRYLLATPIVNAQMVACAVEVTPPTAYKLIERFVEHGLLREVTGARRGKIYSFEPYFRLFD